MTDRIYVTDITKELVAQTLTLACPLHQTGDVDKSDCGRCDLLRPENLRQDLETSIGDRDDSGIGIDGCKRIVGDEDPGIGQCVEEGGLANIRQTDDSDGKTHRRDRVETAPV